MANEKEAAIEIEGVIEEVHKGGHFRIRADNGHEVLATLGGKMRKFRIRVLRGDRVVCQVSPYDLSRGRITYRYR